DHLLRNFNSRLTTQKFHEHPNTAPARARTFDNTYQSLQWTVRNPHTFPRVKNCHHSENPFLSGPDLQELDDRIVKRAWQRPEPDKLPDPWRPHHVKVLVLNIDMYEQVARKKWRDNRSASDPWRLDNTRQEGHHATARQLILGKLLASRLRANHV